MTYIVWCYRANGWAVNPAKSHVPRRMGRLLWSPVANFAPAVGSAAWQRVWFPGWFRVSSLPSWFCAEAAGLQTLAVQQSWRSPGKIYGGWRERAWSRLRESHSRAIGGGGGTSRRSEASCYQMPLTTSRNSMPSTIMRGLLRPKRLLARFAMCAWRKLRRKICQISIFQS